MTAPSCVCDVRVLQRTQVSKAVARRGVSPRQLWDAMCRGAGRPHSLHRQPAPSPSWRLGARLWASEASQSRVRAREEQLGPRACLCAG